MRRWLKGVLLACGLTAILASSAPIPTDAQTRTPLPVPPRLSLPHAQYYANHPAEWRQLMQPRTFVPADMPTAPLAGQPPAANWQSLTNLYPGTSPSAPMLLTDGTVLVHDQCSPNWYKLTPDNTGNYINGTWSSIASLPKINNVQYAPLYFASAVLPDGRLVMNGGEYNNDPSTNSCNSGTWTTLGAMYDPVANTWTAVSPPSGWTTIGDAQSIVLTSGTYMLANCCSKQSALLDATMLTWTLTGTGKFDENDEEGWTLLPNGNVLTVNAYVGTGTCGTNTEIYSASAGTWSSAGSTPSQLADCTGTSEGGHPSYEMGPQVLRPDGTIVAFGALTTGVVVPTAIYNTSNPGWSAGPNLPSTCGANGTTPCNLADAPAALLPNGNILFAVSGGLFKTPTSYFELSTTNVITATTARGNASSDSSYYINFLVLPTGQVLSTDFTDVEIYTPANQNYQSTWQPVVNSVPNKLAPGGTYTLSGTQLSGLSQGASYGDDDQSSTNFPLVKIVNNGTGHVFFARTTNWTVSVAPGAAGSTNFKVPASTEFGPSTLYVVANGIPSAGTAVTISCVALVDTHDFNADCMSDVLWLNGTTGQAVVWLVSGTSVIGGGSPGGAASPWAILGQRDFNGDGKADLLWRNGSTGQLVVWLLNGTTVIGGGSPGGATSPWQVAGAADFNRDGFGDVLWWNSSTGQLVIWFLNGTSVIGGGSPGGAGSPWTPVFTGDFNGDGFADILWWNSTSGQLVIWLLNGTSVIGGGSPGSAAPPWQPFGTGDFNGDGMSDIVWLNTSTGQAVEWFLNGTSVIGGGSPGGAASPWTIAETGDFNGDGKSDLLWYNTTNGQLVIWLLNGATVIGGGSPGGAASPWVIQGMNAD